MHVMRGGTIAGHVWHHERFVLIRDRRDADQADGTGLSPSVIRPRIVTATIQGRRYQKADTRAAIAGANTSVPMSPVVTGL